MSKINLSKIDLNLLVTFEALMDTGSVTKAAEKVGRTQSAVSHALARLRDQVGDPLMVKVGSKMQPSPFALQMIKDVRPILRQIEQVVAPPRAFDPETSTRRFRVAVPAITALIAEVFARVNKEAPNVAVEWVGLGPHLYQAVADEEIDLALLGADTPLPEGLMEQVMPTLKRYTYMRKDHPAAENWNKQAWLDWPHVMVGLSNAARQTVEDKIKRDGLERRIGAHLPEFSGVAPLLARTNMLGTSAQLFMAQDVQTYGLIAKTPPIDLPDITFRFFWSARLSQDPGSKWLRSLVIGAYETIAERAQLASKT
ncbi:LysR family transcriptional regulator [Marivita hallyeonensis]|uniref:Transcriptional regulator, LysR family n=1 Tax=Marivita hallyeonensis TaxID=996342 RepID=A0A1M5R4C9_9RHOB|nr:LysR family transcriptional regulator [Marivita hallyeonensis]SHH21028.1 transcriptional regulator, LysR family [Marivita hallyeonensis]